MFIFKCARGKPDRFLMVRALAGTAGAGAAKPWTTTRKLRQTGEMILIKGNMMGAVSTLNNIEGKHGGGGPPSPRLRRGRREEEGGLWKVACQAMPLASAGGAGREAKGG